jgi:hypothetical protein
MGGDGDGGTVRDEPEEKAAPAAEPADKPEPEGKGEFVPYSSVTQQRQPGSRRSRAAQETEALINERLTGALKPLEERWGSERQTYQQQIAQQNEALARLHGQLEAMQRMPAAPPPPKPDLPDPDKLMQEAEAALDQKDIRTYHAKMGAAVEAKARRIAEEQVGAVRKEMEGRIPQQMPQEVQFLMAQHRNVALAGQAGVEAVMLKDKELELYRHPRSPQRLAKAFELADKFLAQVNGQTGTSSRGYSQDAAQALAAVPTSRPSSGGGGGTGDDGVTLTPLQLETIKNLGWTKQEYVKWLSPDKFVKR